MANTFLDKLSTLEFFANRNISKGQKNLASQRFLLIGTPVYVSDYSGVKFSRFKVFQYSFSEAIPIFFNRL